MEKSSRRNAVQVPRANEIKDASTFLRLKNSEKRAILRASGVNQLPRPREGIRAVIIIIIIIIIINYYYYYILLLLLITCILIAAVIIIITTNQVDALMIPLLDEEV